MPYIVYPTKKENSHKSISSSQKCVKYLESYTSNEYMYIYIYIYIYIHV